MTDHTFLLADGRTLGYSCYGPEAGRPVLYFHGTPGSRLELHLGAVFGFPIEPLLHHYNLRLIAPDRPGMGTSTFHPERNFETVAADVAALAAALHLPPCPLLCWSGGGPYALAVAHLYPSLTQSVFLIAAFTCSFNSDAVYEQLGWNSLYFTTARHAPLVLEGTLALLRHITIHTPIQQHLYELSAPDYALLKNVDACNAFLNHTVKEAVKNGTDGAVQEAALYFEPFPFEINQLALPMHFWWGTHDTLVPYIHAKHLEQNAPNATPHFKMTEGHLSIYVHGMDEVLQTIATTF